MNNIIAFVPRGLRPLPDEEVKSLYHGTHVAIENMSSFYGTVSPLMLQPNVVLFHDFCLPFVLSQKEANILSHVLLSTGPKHAPADGLVRTAGNDFILKCR